MCQDDMEGILRSLDWQYIGLYDKAIATLLNYSEYIDLSWPIIFDLEKLKSYFSFLFTSLFAFPKLAHYRPMLLFYIVEINKCVDNYQQWRWFLVQNLDRSKKLLCNVSSPIANKINKQTNTLLNRFLEFRWGLMDVALDEQIFRQDSYIKAFDGELSDIYDLLIECERLHDLTALHNVYNPILSYISVMLLGYAFTLRPSFLLWLMRIESSHDYMPFLKKDQFIESMRGFYWDRWKSLTSDFDPQRYYYFRGTNPSIKSYRYHYMSANVSELESSELLEDNIYYVGVDPDTGDTNIIGTTKEDFELIAYLEEEITMPVVCLWLDQSMVNILSSSEDHPEKQDIKSLIQDEKIRLILTTKLDPDLWFVISIADSEGRIADTFIFTHSELQELQLSS